MKTHAVRLYGKNDLRLESFNLPEIKDDEILARVISDSLCMSSYKATKQGEDHKRVPDDVFHNPVIIGHEFSGEIVEVGALPEAPLPRPGVAHVERPVGALQADGELAHAPRTFRHAQLAGQHQ